jgi:sugar phosphate isomerase/epimerase
VKFGFNGVEFRGLLSEIELEKVSEFSPTRIAATRRQLTTAEIEAVCLSTSVQILSATVSDVDLRKAVATVRYHIEMAHELGTPFVRIFGGEPPAGMARDDVFNRAAEALQFLGNFAEPRNVMVLVETHDSLVNSNELSALLRLTQHPAVRVLWDIHHPYRLAGESISQTMRRLQGQIVYTHIKDSVLDADGVKYTFVPVGSGDVPILEAMHFLHRAGYNGYLTFEWEKRWHPELDPAEVVFPKYIQKMRNLMNEM